MPPYAPDFNPIEQCWSKVKQILRSLKARTAEALEQAVAQALAAITPDNAQAWFAHWGLYVYDTEGQQTRGVYILCSGKAKLSTSSSDGKTIITRIGKAGEALGLGASIVNHPHEVTAEMIEPGQANFISRESLLELLKDNGEIAMRVGQQLSFNYFTACEEIRTLGISRSPAEKFAKLLLSWCAERQSNRCAQVKLAFTHGEIAEMIGTNRETVTRLFTDIDYRLPAALLLICGRKINLSSPVWGR